MPTAFLVIGLGIAVTVWVLQRKNWGTTARAILVVLALLGTILASYLVVGPPTLGDHAWGSESPLREVVLFALMAAGMAARYLTGAIERRREAIEVWRRAGTAARKPGIEFDAWEFSYPLFFSVVTFGALLGQIQSNSVTLSNAVLSFETGFFWQTILAKRQAAVTN